MGEGISYRKAFSEDANDFGEDALDAHASLPDSRLRK